MVMLRCACPHHIDSSLKNVHNAQWYIVHIRTYMYITMLQYFPYGGEPFRVHVETNAKCYSKRSPYMSVTCYVAVGIVAVLQVSMETIAS